MKRRVALVAITILAAVFSGCTPKKPEEAQSPIPPITKPLPPEQAKKTLSEVGSSFVYGPGLGSAMLNVGGIVLFPPYAVYVVGNAVMDVAGYKPWYVSRLLPEEDEKQFNETYDEVVSGPGKVAAAIAGKEYRTRESVKARIEEATKETK